ncbi:Uncharacterised protein [Vibrio cholerae]|nr:Uncharacterised protein [Vibrio cholerae]
MINAPSPKVSLIEMAWIQQKSDAASKTPTPIDCKHACREACFNAFKQNGNKQSEAAIKRKPIKPNGGNS